QVGAATAEHVGGLFQEILAERPSERDTQAPSEVKTASKSWIGIASRETNAGPELAVQFEDGRRTKIGATADTVLLSYMADYPLGTHEILSIDMADTNRILLRFDFALKGRVKKAELLLARSQNRHPSPSEPIKLALHTVNEAWDEGK